MQADHCHTLLKSLDMHVENEERLMKKYGVSVFNLQSAAIYKMNREIMNDPDISIPCTMASRPFDLTDK